MTKIDWTALEADRENGTPGPWRIRNCDSIGHRCTNYYQEIWNEETDILVTTEVTRAHNDGGAVNMRRIARLPELEAYALAARKKLKAAEKLAEAIQKENWTEDETWAALDAWDAAQETGQ